MSGSFVFVYFLAVSASVCLFWLAEEQQLYHMSAGFVFVYFSSVSASCLFIHVYNPSLRHSLCIFAALHLF